MCRNNNQSIFVDSLSPTSCFRNECTAAFWISWKIQVIARRFETSLSSSYRTLYASIARLCSPWDNQVDRSSRPYRENYLPLFFRKAVQATLSSRSGNEIKYSIGRLCIVRTQLWVKKLLHGTFLWSSNWEIEMNPERISNIALPA